MATTEFLTSQAGYYIGKKVVKYAAGKAFGYAESTVNKALSQTRPTLADFAADVRRIETAIHALSSLPWPVPKGIPVATAPRDETLGLWREIAISLHQLQRVLRRSVVVPLGGLLDPLQPVTEPEESLRTNGLHADLYEDIEDLNLLRFRVGLERIAGTPSLRDVLLLTVYIARLFASDPGNFRTATRQLLVRGPLKWQAASRLAWDAIITALRNVRNLDAWLGGFSPDVMASSVLLEAAITSQSEVRRLAKDGLDLVRPDVYVAQVLWTHSCRPFHRPTLARSAADRALQHQLDHVDGPLYLPEFLTALRSFSPVVYYADPESSLPAILLDCVMALGHRTLPVAEWTRWLRRPNLTPEELITVTRGVVEAVDGIVHLGRHLPGYQLRLVLHTLLEVVRRRQPGVLRGKDGLLFIRVHLICLACLTSEEEGEEGDARRVLQRGTSYVEYQTRLLQKRDLRRQRYLDETAVFDGILSGQRFYGTNLLEVLGSTGSDSLAQKLVELDAAWADTAGGPASPDQADQRTLALLHVLYFFVELRVLPPSLYHVIADPAFAPEAIVGGARRAPSPPNPMPAVMAAVKVLQDLSELLPASHELDRVETELRECLVSKEYRKLLPAAMDAAEDFIALDRHPAAGETLRPLLLQGSYLLPSLDG